MVDINNIEKWDEIFISGQSFSPSKIWKNARGTVVAVVDKKIKVWLGRDNVWFNYDEITEITYDPLWAID